MSLSIDQTRRACFNMRKGRGKVSLFVKRLRCVLFLLPSLLLTAQAFGSQEQTKVSSVNLCTDQLLIELVDLDRIESLSFLAVDKQYSPNWEIAQNFHLNHAQIEELFLLESPTILMSAYTAANLSDTLKKINKNVIRTISFTDLQSLKKELLRISKKLEVQPRAEKLNQQLTQIEKIQPPAKKVRALWLAAGGYTIGNKTIEHELLSKAGFSNVAVERGVENFSALSLEEVIVLQPDIIFLDDTSNSKVSSSQRLLKHPALKRSLKNTQFIQAQSIYSVCSPRSIIERYHFLEKVYADYNA